MVNTAYIVSYSSGTSTLTMLLCWKVTFINLVLKAKSLLTLSECSVHMTAPLPAIPTSIKKSSESKCSLRELCFDSSFPRLLSIFQHSLTINSVENSSVYRREWHTLPVFRKNFSMQLKKNFYSLSLLSPLSRHGQRKISEGRRGRGKKTTKVMSKEYLWSSLFFSSPVLPS